MAERRAAALSLDPGLLGELLGRAELRDLLDPDVIATVEADLQRLSPGRRARGLEGTADLLRLLGPLSAEEAAARLQAEEGDDDGHAPEQEPAPSASVQTAQGHLDRLVTDRRALQVRIGGQEKYAAVEDAARLRDALGVALPMGLPVAFIEPVADPLADVVARYARTHGPFTPTEASACLLYTSPSPRD